MIANRTEVVQADYLAEVRELGGLPAEGPTEIAIAGRSNVGKSTLLNRLAGRKALARTSKTPGRTRGIIFYDLVARIAGATAVPLRLVDLPGYGYAQVSRVERKSWGPLVERYVKSRRTLRLFVTLVDARRGLDEEERQLLTWLGTLDVRHRLVLTKIDKLSRTQRGPAVDRCRAALAPGALPPLVVSGETGEGVDRLWAEIAHALTSVDGN